jgi:leucyl aminopeptidase
MDTALRPAELATRVTGLLAVGVHEGIPRRGTPAAELDVASKGALKALLASGDFAGRAGEMAMLYPGGVKAKRVLVVGLGPAGELSERAAFNAAATASRRARDAAAGTLALALPAATDPTMRAIGEGVVLGHHRHTAYLTSSKPPLTRTDVVVAHATASAKAALASGVIRGEAVSLARDLASTPGQDLPPAALAERAREVAKRVGAKATVHDVAALERLGMGLVLAVGRGSPNPPCFIELVHEQKKAAKLPTVVVIGKGVTFDTGGVSLKPREGMNKMKYDMSGAAAVLGLFASLDTLSLPFRLVGLIPSAENVIGSRAIKPGDVMRAMDGTTVEMTNTDAEGRLLLADALVYARRFTRGRGGPRHADRGHLDRARPARAGLFATDAALAAQLRAAGEETGERLWPMPVGPEYLSEMRGETADLVNSNERREGGSCTAAAFLMHFAQGLPWAHLDIASTAWTYADRPDSQKGPNAFGVRLLVRWLETRAASKR